MPTPDLEKIIERLNDLQRRDVIGQHAIGGAFAFIFYAEPMTTRDLDVFAELPTSGGLSFLPGNTYFIKILGQYGNTAVYYQAM